MTPDTPPSESVAIIGMAGRFPQSGTLDAFWANLRAGHEAITAFSPEMTEALPVEPVPRADDPNFVRARAALERAEWFDAAFFGINPREAAMMDPQQRVFLECSWDALENAACDPQRFDGLIGVFAGAGFNTYLINNLLTNPSLIAEYGLFPTIALNDKDYLCTRVAYKFNLRGPCVTVQTACSTSLVAVCIACQNLLSYQCDLALAGGVSIAFPTNRGHVHAEGGIMSRDGHCRAFDAHATGTVLGSGAGIVVLKRLSDALAAGDRIRAVIRGSAMNNDGAGKIGFTAPSVDGQAECIAMAQSMAGFDPETVTYIEAHGTGTPIGDPIELAALSKAFGNGSGKRGYCGVGSLKTNLGHLDVAAGVAGLIKTALALEHREIPPSLHFETPNAQIDFANSPFYVTSQLQPWKQGTTPRRAGVSSFGMGGTNAHVALEEAPPAPTSSPSRSPELLVLSARTDAALQAGAQELARHLEQHPSVNMSDVAFTLQVGRKRFEHRRAFVVRDAADAISTLRMASTPRIAEAVSADRDTNVAFLFPGQGAQAVDMARGVYERDPGFRERIDLGCALLKPELGLDLRDVLFPGLGNSAPMSDAAELLRQTRLTQPALFIVEYALAQLWQRWGVSPSSMIGHSLGEYVAACLAGVFTFEEGVRLVAERARLVQALPAGAMLAVPLDEARARAWVREPLALAAVNGPRACVIAGPLEEIAVLEQRLATDGVAYRRLTTSHAFHSAMVEPAMKPLATYLRAMKLRPPLLRWISNVTGNWISPSEATDPEYWATQLRRTVRFSDGVTTLGGRNPGVLLEVGPGATLSGLVRHHVDLATRGTRLASTLDPREPAAYEPMLRTLGQLWCWGVTPDWRAGVHAGETRIVVGLPSYSFERKRCWIEPGSGLARAALPTSNGATCVSEAETAEMHLDAGRPASAPTAAEDKVRAVFEGLAGTDLSESLDRTFHQLGFDSLFLAQVSASLNRRLGMDVSFRQLRDEFHTIREVACALDRKSGPSPLGSRHLPTPARRHAFPLSEAQREIWTVSQLSPAASRAYTESVMLKLAGRLDVEALGRALQALIRRHEALRTVFATGGDEQYALEDMSCDLIVSDAPLANGGAAALLDEALRRPFNLTTGPLLRARVVKVGENQHEMALIVHHLICDGWSLGVLVRDLGRLYAIERGLPSPELPPPPRFSDYAARRLLSQAPSEFSAAEAHWRTVFADGVPTLDMPTDRPRRTERSYAGALEARTFAPELSRELKAFCLQHESTLFTAVLAAFTALLHRLSGQADLVVGVPTASQALDGAPDLVGHFANLIPIRSVVAEHTSFSAHLGAVQKALTEALDHWRYPYVRLLQQLKLPRDSSQVPLTPVLFNTNHLRGELKLGDVSIEPTLPPKHFVNFDVNFNLAIVGDSIVLGCYFSTELYDRPTIARWLRHFETLLRSVLAKPAVAIAAAPLLTADEERHLLETWNNTALPYDRDATVDTLFTQQVTRTPERTALVTTEERLTYRQLNQRADALARELRAAGVGPDTPVGLCLGRSARLVVAMLAVLKAGGAYVPLDPKYPADRLEFMVRDTAMPLVVAESGTLERVPSGTHRVLVLKPDTDDADLAAAKTDALQDPCICSGPEHLAYILYTSGSTGKPKGVAVRQRGVVAHIAWAKQQFTPEELDGVLFATSAAFDISVFEVFCPLCLGGKVVLAENVLQLANLPARSEIRLLNGVPSPVAEVVRAAMIPPSVTTVTLAGEPVPQSVVDGLYELPHVQRVFEWYGPTETTVFSTGGLRQRGSRPTLGRPLPNERVYVLDGRMQPVPIGVRGELYIGGDKVARGYLNRPDLTAGRFIASPFVFGDRLYRTGDIVRWCADGTIESLGRADHQVKIRGFRIELGEIEQVLRLHPTVSQAIAIARRDATGTDRLLAYVTCREGCVADPRELRQHVAAELPDYMVPVAITRLDRFPTTATGKVDRNALPDPEFGDAAAGDKVPRSETEEILAQIWMQVLGLSAVAPQTNFFALGGNSLQAMQIVTRVNSALGIDLTWEDFFSGPTLTRLAAKAESAMVEQVRAETR